MKKFSIFALLALFAGVAFGQGQNQVRTKKASVEQMTLSVDYSQRFNELNQQLDQEMMRAKQMPTEGQTLSPNGKVAAVSPVAIGRASNAFSILRPEQNQVWANDSLNTVAFIHRHDVTIWGGGGGENGKLRYDLSTDGGATFTNDLGEINPVYQRPSRYPNLSGFNNSGTSNPFDAHVVYAAPTLDPSPDWDGHVNGLWTIDASTPTGTENYSLLTSNSYLPGGLCQGLPGEYWSVDWEYDGASILGNLFINKGVYNSQTMDIDWTRFDTLTPNHYTGFDGSASIIGPNIAFSPDGQIGWIGFLGDLVGGPDTTYNPVFIKSTDGGATWGTAQEMDMNSIAWVADSLQSLWIDSLGNPASTGRATSAFDYDLTVDFNGNPHLGLIVCSASTTTNLEPSYSIYPGLAKFYADVYSMDGGATWDMAYISPVLSFRTNDFGTSTTISMDNFPQISRNSDGNIIFYSWADSDTAQFTGNMTGVGFGESTNLAPNLRIAARNPGTNEQTYPILVSDGDLIWEGRVLMPTMAPEVLWDANNGG